MNKVLIMMLVLVLFLFGPLFLLAVMGAPTNTIIALLIMSIPGILIVIFGPLSDIGGKEYVTDTEERIREREKKHAELAKLVLKFREEALRKKKASGENKTKDEE